MNALFTSLCAQNKPTNKATRLVIEPIAYDDVAIEKEMVKFYRETRHQDGPSWDDPLPYGFIKGIWHEVFVNGIQIPVYSTRCGFGIHSFAFIDIDADGSFALDVKVNVLEGHYCQSLVLPESKKVISTINDDQVTFRVNDYGDYTVCFGREEIGPDKGLTLYFFPHRNLPVIDGYKTITFNAEDYHSFPAPSLNLTEEKVIYYFKKGRYYINSLSIPNDAIVYFENGSLLEFFEEDNQPCIYNTGKNLTILGHVLIELSHIMGGYKKQKNACSFNDLESGYVEGQLYINSHSWTMCFNNCDNVEIANNVLLAYRTFSDGIMLAGCKDCVVHYNFARTGDDAFEAKATSSRILESNNLLFEYNSTWTDKANAYGVIYESNAPITDVYFRHNSVGFAQPCWAYHLGSFTVQRGTNFEHLWSNIHFEDGEVYYSNNPIMTVFNSAVNIFDYGDPLAKRYGGRLKDIYFKNITVKRHELNDLPIVYSLNLFYRENPKFPEYIDHLELGNIYIDNVNYLGEIITKENLMEHAFVHVPEGVNWSMDNIKINTLKEE